MAIGRISGPLLKSNLIRNGIDLAFETDLLYLDVTNNRIGINTATPEHDLDVNGTIRTTNLLLDKLTAGSITIENNDITSSTGTIDLGTADQVVYQNKLVVDSFEINDNTIRTTDSNANLELDPSGTGTIELLANTNVSGNLHATGNISADGDIVLGDADTDSINFNAEIASNIIPDGGGSFTLGEAGKTWSTVFANTVDGQTINANQVNIAGINLNTRHANTLYVSENGSNNNAGNHPQSPYQTVEKALQNATSGDTIHIYPGEYQERLPLVVPVGVTVKGHSMRSVTIKPDSVDSEDVFHLNGETTVEDLTIKDFYYNSGTNVGHAFRFAPSFKVTSRSPYIRNITVITKGSVTNASDPRGFNQGDAGKGAYLDGSVAHADSKEASCLFHATTFITPGVDALTFTNGVRIEWLNSFTYFANRGFYAVNGSTGLKGSGETEFRVSDVDGSFSAGETFAVNSIDGSTVIASGTIDRVDADDKFYISGNVSGITEATTRTAKTIKFNGNAKLQTGNKKFGSASANLDGINSYLSVGANDDFGFGTDDFTLEAWIYAASTTGEQPIYDLRAGIATDTAPYFYLDGTTLKYQVGNATPVISGGTITVNTWHHVAVSKISTGTRMYLDGNQVGSTYVDNNDYGFTKPVFIGANFDLANYFTGNIDDVRISNSARYLDTTYTVPTMQITGDSNCVLLTHLDGANNATTVEEDIKVKQNLTFSGGATANFIDLYNTTDFGGELRSIGSANVYGNKGAVGDGTGVIMYLIGHNFAYIGNGKEVTNDETTVVQANEVEELNNAKVRFTSVDHKGDFRVGDNFYVNQETGEVVFDAVNLNITTPDGITFGTGGNVTFIDGTKIETGDFRLSGNTIETLTQNFVIDSATNIVDIEADTNITGNLSVTGNFTLGGNITIGDADTDSVEFASDINSDILPNTDNTFDLGSTSKRWKNIYTNNFDNGNLKIEGNKISTQDSDSDLELVASGTGSVTVPNNNVEITGTFTANDTATFNNTVTVNNDLNVTGDLNALGSITISADLTVEDGLTVNGNTQLENINIAGNKIQTTESNSDLELDAAGTGRVVFPNADLEVGGDIVVNGSAQYANLSASGTITADTVTVNTATINGQLNLEDIEINDNYITTTESNSNLELRASGTGKVVFPDNDVNITGDLDVTGTVSFNTLSGNVYTTNSLTVNEELTINGQVQFEDIEINDNYITTTLSDSDLELRANGTGQIVFRNNTNATGNLTVDGITTFTGSVTGTTATFDDVIINNNMTVQGQINFDNIQINDNFITTTESDSDLELQANGAGNVIIPSNNVVVEKDLTVQGVLNADNLDALGRVTANSFSTGDILIDDNFITTTQSNSDLELRANGTGNVTLDDIKFNNNIISSTADMVLNPGSGILEIDSVDSMILPNGTTAQRNTSAQTGMLRYNTTTNNFEGYNGSWVILDGGLQDNDGDTKITPELTPGANDNVIRFYNAGALTADLTSQRFSTNKLIVDDIEIDGNEIKTITTNTDLVLSGNGTGGILLDHFKFNGSTITNTVSDAITIFDSTATGYYKFAGTGGVVIPTGNNVQRPTPINAEEGMMRYNNEDDRVEIFDGTNWVSVAGSSGGISRNDAEGIALEFVLVLG